jgi:hypothetical protein
MARKPLHFAESHGKTMTHSSTLVAGFGFPVVLHNAPTVEIFGESHADVDSNLLPLVVSRALALLDARWTGAQLRWARRFMNLTHEQLAEAFRLERSTVTKWESRRDKSTGMPWTSEQAVRAQLLRSLGETHFGASTLLCSVTLQDSHADSLTIDWPTQQFGYAAHRWLCSSVGAHVMQHCGPSSLVATPPTEGSSVKALTHDGDNYDVAG